MAASENVQRALFLEEQAALYRQGLNKLDSSMNEIHAKAREQLQQEPQGVNDWIRTEVKQQAERKLSRLPQARKLQGGAGDK